MEDVLLENEAPIQSIEVDSLVVLQIVRHSQSVASSTCTGQLLGLDQESVLSITHSFPFPASAYSPNNAGGGGGGEDEEMGVDNTVQYQLDMMRCLREANVDHNTVGWYQCLPKGASQGWLNTSMVETQWNYQKSLGEHCVFLVYEMDKSLGKSLALSAYRLSEPFCQVYKTRKQQFTTESLRSAKLTTKHILKEIPVCFRVNSLGRVLLESTAAAAASSIATAEEEVEEEDGKLALSAGRSLEKSLEGLVEVIEDWTMDTNSWHYWWRNTQRELNKQQQLLQKRIMENQQRAAQGMSLLPEDEFGPQHAKVLPEPSRLDTLLIGAALDGYCEQVESLAGAGLTKAYTAKAIVSQPQQ